MNIVIPMAGAGTRMATRFGAVPKPLIDVAGRPMIAWALDSLKDMLPGAKVVFIILREHDQEFGIGDRLRDLAGDQIEIVSLDRMTDGQLSTVMAASSLLDKDDDLLIANCDTFVVSDLATDIRNKREDCRGIISVADMPGDRWSFAKTDQTGRVVEVAEKVRISDHASTGIYYFRDTGDFIKTSAEIIEGRKKTRGEYYVITVYEEYIRRNWRVDISTAFEMWDLGTPEALDRFLRERNK